MAAVLGSGISIYFYANNWAIVNVGWNPATTMNMWLGVVLILLVIEGSRRVAGPVFVLVCVIIGLYPIFADKMPGVLFGFQYPFAHTMSLYAFGSNGLLGIPAKVMGLILIGFQVFAGVMIVTGAGKFFLSFAESTLGKYRGGPAKVAVVSSALFGSLSGSSLSNVVATGSITIPAMKQTGYPAHYAGAIEACASTGGGLVPPIMGNVVFVMVVFLGIDYATIMGAAIIPAILFYFGLMLQVDAYAARVGIKGISMEGVAPLRTVLKTGWPYISAIGFLIWGLAYMRWQPATAAFYGAALMMLLSFSRRETMLTPKRLLETAIMVGKLITQTFAVLIPVGIVVAGLVVTGTSAAFTASIVQLGGENIYLIMLLGIVASYILGMAGLITPGYIFLAVSFAPAAISVGQLDPVAVHLFIIYYVMLAVLTPPVATAAFLAAALAGASPMKTSLAAMRFGVVVYFIPVFFVFNPALILRGNPTDVLYLLPLCLIGVVFIAAGLQGYLWRVGNISLWVRGLLILGGFGIAFPEWWTTLGGAILLVPAVSAAVMLNRRNKLTADPSPS